MGDPNIAEMTDEQIMNVDDSDFQSVGGDEQDYELPELDHNDKSDVEPETEVEDEEIKPQNEPQTEDEHQEEEPAQEVEVTEDEPQKEETNSEDTQLDPEVLAPLRANGKDLQLNSVEELRNLASMGANYSLKMQNLKPHIKMLKTLEKHDLLDPDKLNHMIALTKGDKGAISKLLDDTGIDPNYMELPESDSYQPNDYAIPDSEIALNDVLESISTSPHYSTTMDILGNRWDKESMETLAANPESIRTINSQVENGMYGKIWGEVERQRMLGNLTTQTDVQAYDIVGESMQSQGMFNPTEDSGSDVNRNAQRKAAGATRNLGTTKAKKKELTEMDIMSMTDEQIEAMSFPGLT